SLRRLDTDRIDLYYLHIWDFTTRPEEVMRGLEDLVRSGKVVYIGISDTPAWLVSRCNTLAELRGWERFAALQIEYSLVERTPERDLLPLARADDMSVCTWSPLASGLLSGKYTRDGSETGRRKVTESRRYTDRNLAIARTVDAIADEIGASSAQVALAWQRQHDPRALPIIGARTLDQLRDNLGCLHIRLGDDHMQRLAEVSAIELGFPHDFLRGDAVRTFTTAGCADQVDNHRPLG
ncbi:MAG: aldo/keto reductase, partial [Planctomycetota bacterium]